jgi:signal transduction histidine kinase/anti-sigma regulatory factor (Ser/Thr protein kinase)
MAKLPLMAGGLPTAIPVDEASRVGQARRAAQQMAESLGFDETDAGRAALVAMELATNILKHAQRGEIHLQPAISQAGNGLEIVAVDRGPGFDFAACIADGFSTRGTQGIGLGAVARQAEVLDLYADARGAVVMARLYRRGTPHRDVRYGAAARPIHGESVSGDAWRIAFDGADTQVLLIDGLGHGASAHAAAQRGVDGFDSDPLGEPDALMGALHVVMGGTPRRRGGACALRWRARCAALRGHRQLVRSAAHLGGIAWPGLASGHRGHAIPARAGLRLPRCRRQAARIAQRWPADALEPARLPRAGRPAPGRHRRRAVARPGTRTRRRHRGGTGPGGRAMTPIDDEVRRLRDESDALRAELEETNQGVLALYAELDTQAEELRQASELKSRFLSYMSHEFRTPLGSILSMTRLLHDELDGPLNEEQHKQVHFISGAASELSEMVDDLLDLAKIEAGRVTISPGWFEMVDLFSALRGMFRPIVEGADVDLVFEEPIGMPALYTDDKKVAQILRNFISNALKFTPSGTVRVRASSEGGDWVRFFGDRHGHRHPCGTARQVVRGFQPDRIAAATARARHRPWTGAVQALRIAARWGGRHAQRIRRGLGILRRAARRTGPAGDGRWRLMPRSAGRRRPNRPPS